MLWGGTAYHVSHVKTNKTCIQRIRTSKAIDKLSEKRILLKELITLEPHQIRIVKIKVNEPPGTKCVIYPKPHFCSQSFPVLMEVDNHQTVPVIIDQGWGTCGLKAACGLPGHQVRPSAAIDISINIFYKNIIN